MKKRFIVATTTTAVALLGLSFSSLAAPQEPFPDHHEFSAEDKAALTDAHIAALKAGLKLTPAQEKNWPALETVLRDVAKARSALAAERREKAEERHEHPNLIEGLHEHAKILTGYAAELGKIADAAKPLYDSLDEAQKHRFGLLLHSFDRQHHHFGHDGRRED